MDNASLELKVGLTASSVSDDLFAVVPAGGEGALPERPGPAGVGLQVLVQGSAHQKPGKQTIKDYHLNLIDKI